MWKDFAVPLAVALTTVIGSGLTRRWSEPGSARRVTQARAEAELLQLMPDGPAKAALVEKLEVDVLKHVSLEEDREFRTLFKAALVIVVAQGLTAGVIAFSLLNLPHQGEGLNTEARVGIGSVLLALLLQGTDYLVRRRMRAIRTKATEEAEDEVAKGTSHGHIEFTGTAGGSVKPAGEGHLDLGASGG